MAGKVSKPSWMERHLKGEREKEGKTKDIWKIKINKLRKRKEGGKEGMQEIKKQRQRERERTRKHDRKKIERNKGRQILI